MMQRKEPSKVLIHADNVEFDKHLEHLKQSSEHQDGITSGDHMNMSRSIQLSDSEAFQSSLPSRQSFSKPRRKQSSPSHVPVTAKSPQKKQPLMRTDMSPHYMKPTRGSGAKKELFPASLSNSQSDYDYKDQEPKFSNNQKASVVPGKKPAKTLIRPSASVRQLCPYTFCSLNGHHRTPLPPLKSFLSKRRSLLKAQKTMMQEELSLQRSKVFKTEVSDIDLSVIDGKSACRNDEDFFIEIYANGKEHTKKPAATGHGQETRKQESSEELEDQEGMKFKIEENSLAIREVDIKQITTNLSDESPELKSNSKKDLKKYYDDTVTKADTMLSLHQEQSGKSADENHLPNCSHEDTSMEICCRGIIFNDWEQLGSSGMNGCDSEVTDTEWKEKQFCTSNLEERVVLAVLKEENEFKLESSSESLLEASVKSDKILSTTRLEEIKYLVEEAPQEAKAQECACFEAQPHDIVLDLEATIESTETRSSIGEVFQNLKNAEDNGEKIGTSLDIDVSCVSNVLDVGQEQIFVKDGTPMPPSDQIYTASGEECKLNQVERATDKGRKNLEIKNTETYQDSAKQVDSNDYGRQVQEISELHKIDETNEGIDSSPETDGGSVSQVTQSLLKYVHEAQDKEMLEAIEEKKRRNNWRGEMKHKMHMKDDEQPRNLNQRKPNFLPLIPNPEREKVILKHQIMDKTKGKSSEQWMTDHALRQAVTKLAPVRRSKVALLVQAFETVMPITQK